VKYRVVWIASAVDELAHAWINADSQLRELIVAAAHYIDEQLAMNPYAASESRPGGRRIQFVFPLGIHYRIENDATVVVTHLWCFGGRRRQR
jgi:hypothetical protein